MIFAIWQNRRPNQISKAFDKHYKTFWKKVHREDIEKCKKDRFNILTLVIQNFMKNYQIEKTF